MAYLTKNLEYIFSSPQKIIFDRLAYASGLAEWYANDVRISGDIISFIWEGYEESYSFKCSKNKKIISFVLIEDSENTIEFKILKDEFSNNVVLQVIISFEKDEIEDMADHLDSSIRKMKNNLGEKLFVVFEGILNIIIKKREPLRFTFLCVIAFYFLFNFSINIFNYSNTFCIVRSIF